MVAKQNEFTVKFDPSNIKLLDMPVLFGYGFIGIGFAIAFPRRHTDFPVPMEWGLVCIAIGVVLVVFGYFLKKFLK